MKIPWTKIIDIMSEAYEDFREEGSEDDQESPGEVTLLEYVEISAKTALKVVEACGEDVG